MNKYIYRIVVFSFLLTISLNLPNILTSDSFSHLILFLMIISAYGLFYNIFKFVDSILNVQNEKEKDFEEHMKNFHNFINDYMKNKNYYSHNNQQYNHNILSSFKLLELNTNDDVNTIKKKYRKLALKWHPDKFVNDSKKNQEISKSNFQKINNAYSIIKKYKKFS